MNDHERQQAMQEIARKYLKDCLSLLDSNPSRPTDWQRLAKITQVLASHAKLERKYQIAKPRNAQ